MRESFDVLIVGLGWLTLICVCAVAVYVAVEFVLSAAMATSILRWEVACMRAGNRRPKWERLLPSFFRYTVEMLGVRRGSVTMQKTEGEWRWIGDWTASSSAREGRGGGLPDD
jgi:hypothetical protein